MKLFKTEEPIIMAPIPFLRSKGASDEEIEYILNQVPMQIDKYTWGRILYALNMHQANKLAEKQVEMEKKE